MAEEAKLVETEHGLAPDGDGWFVVNAREAPWEHHETFGRDVSFETREHRFAEYGFHIGILEPGQPNCMYHREDAQEDFLVLKGECILIVEGEERRLKAWDFVHCPPWVEHVFVGAGDGPCLMIAMGSRTRDDVVYPVSEVAQRHGAGVDAETPHPREAYAKYSEPFPVRYREGDLPDF